MRGRVLFCVLVCSIVAAAASAEDRMTGTRAGPYVAAGGGIVYVPEFPSDKKLKNDKTVGRDDSWAFALGWSVHGAVGFDLGNHTRAEAEFSYLTAGIGSLEGARAKEFRVPPRAATMSFMAVALYELDTGVAFRPFIGLGIGAARTSAFTGTPKTDETRLPAPEGDYAGWGGAYQAKAGVVYQVFDELAIHLGYRFFVIAPTTLTQEKKIGKDDPRHARYDTKIVTLPFPGTTAHRIELGVSYRLPS